MKRFWFVYILILFPAISFSEDIDFPEEEVPKQNFIKPSGKRSGPSRRPADSVNDPFESENIEGIGEDTKPDAPPLLKPKRQVEGPEDLFDEDELTPKRKSNKKIKKRSRADIHGTVGLTAGVALLRAGSATIQTNRSNQGLTTNFPFGIQADVRAYENFGVELDAYYGYTQSLELSLTTGTGTVTENKSPNRLGAILFGKYVFPFRLFNTAWSVHGGPGAALYNMKESVNGRDGNVNNSISTKAFIVDVGLSSEPITDFTVSADYALSPYAQSSASGDLTFDDSAFFHRFRLAVAYKFENDIALGLQGAFWWLTVKSNAVPTFTSSLSPTSPTDIETEIHFSGYAGYSF
jgi:opacity protein-like surface antigen